MATRKGKGAVEEFAVGLVKGEWFDPLKQNQKIEGTLTRIFETDSKYKNMREESDNFKKKRRSNWEVSRSGKSPIIFSERGGGDLQKMLDVLSVGDRVFIEFSHLEREGDNARCPASVKTVEQLNKWKGGKKVRAFPVFKRLARIPGGGSRGKG